MPKPRDPRKEECDALARSLAGEEPDAVARVRALSRALVSVASSIPPPEAVARDVLQRYTGGEPRPIGVWHPRGTGDAVVFERDEGALTAEWWADTPILRPKRSLLPLRVCLLGESTAAGWFYAPDLTPARVLEGQLRSWAGERTFEVLDLCMVNLQASALVELFGSALQLAPDVIVVFAGNNWPVGLPVYAKASLPEREAAAVAFAAEGFPGLVRRCAERSRAQADRTLETLARIAEGASVPLVLVAPESNLVDWHRDRPVPWLRGGGARAWHEAHRRARSSLADGRLAEAQTAAALMVDLDEGVCATSWRLLAEAHLALGLTAQAREAFERAVEARAWDNHPSTPSATRPVRDALAQAAREYALPFVDLREVFAAQCGPEPPGRRLFLDYCHLTAEGMRIAMAAVAVRLLALADPARAPASDALLLARGGSPEPQPETEARARFLSALYGAHYGSGYDPETGSFLGGAKPPVRHWLQTALETAPGVAETVRAWVDTRVAPPGALPLSLAQQRFLSRLGNLERQSALGAGLDPELVEEACAQLERLGVPAGEEVRRAWAVRPARPLELVNPHFLWAAAENRGPEAGLGLEGHAYHRARWSASHFCLPLPRPLAVRLRCTARLPSPTGKRTGTLRFLVNGEAGGQMDLRERWERGVIHLAAFQLRPGYNRITLLWPDLPEAGDSALAQIRDRLHAGLPTDLHPVFGELFSLRAQPLE